LIQLFTKYQISSDLLSYDESIDGPSSGAALAQVANSNRRLTSVKAHVKAIVDMLDQTKTEQLKARLLEVKYNAKEQSKELDVFYDGSLLDLNSTHNAREQSDEQDEQDDFCDDSDSMHPVDSMLMSASTRRMSMTQKMSRSAAPMAKKSVITSRSSSSPAVAVARSLSASTSTTPNDSGTISMRSNYKEVSAPGGTDVSGSAVPSDDKVPIPIDDAYGIPGVQPASRSPLIDYTKYPSKLDSSYELLDPDSKFRATIINVGKNWTKSSQASLLSGSSTINLSESQLDSEKYAAFDLLDALTKSGALPIEQASLHVVIAGTQCFDQSLMDAVVSRNINPIDRVERSTLIMASTLYDEPTKELIHADQVQRVNASSPMLFIEN